MLDGEVDNVRRTEQIDCQDLIPCRFPFHEVYFVDSMSAFGAVPLDLVASSVDYLVSSANKCIEGVPGIAFVICRREALEMTNGWARTLSLDLLDQWRGLEQNGQFRFTPPPHVLLAFLRALRELEQEGGVTGRAARYRRNHASLVRGMREMGFEEHPIPGYGTDPNGNQHDMVKLVLKL